MFLPTKLLEFLFCWDLYVKLRRPPKQPYRETPDYFSMLYFADELWDWEGSQEDGSN